MTNRRAALDGLARILDAGAPEELFTGAEAEAHFLYGLLVDAVRARGSAYYWEICRTARRRGVTPEYVIDRAAVLLATIEERRRTDLYRLLGVPALSSGETIRQHWLDLAKQHHPDVGGDAAHFRQAQQAYEILRDPMRRSEYERFWLRALGPFERVTPRGDVPPLEAMAASLRAVPRTMVEKAPAPPVNPGLEAVGGLIGRVAALLAPVGSGEIDRVRTEVTQAITDLEAVRDRLASLAMLKRSFET